MLREDQGTAAATQPWSTGITLQVLPKTNVDKIPVLAPGYGFSPMADGKTFQWAFNPPATYWDGASMIITDIANREGGLDKLKGKKIGCIYLDAAYGKEPIPLLEDFSKKYGFELTLYPVPGKEMQNQSAQWLQIRRENPDFVFMWGWGAMNPSAVTEAAKIRYPMDRFYGIWWSGGNDDAAAGGDAAKGYRTMNFHGVGKDFPVIQDIKKYIVDAGKSHVDPAKFADNLYNRGVYNSMLIAEGIRRAQEISGKKVITAADMRDGLENLNIDEARLKEMGMDGFAAPFKTHLRRPFRPSRGLCAGMGRREVAEGVRLVLADDRRRAPDAGEGRRRVHDANAAEARGALRPTPQRKAGRRRGAGRTVQEPA